MLEHLKEAKDIECAEETVEAGGADVVGDAADSGLLDFAPSIAREFGRLDPLLGEAQQDQPFDESAVPRADFEHLAVAERQVAQGGHRLIILPPPLRIAAFAFSLVRQFVKRRVAGDEGIGVDEAACGAAKQPAFGAAPKRLDMPGKTRMMLRVDLREDEVLSGLAWAHRIEKGGLGCAANRAFGTDLIGHDMSLNGLQLQARTGINARTSKSFQQTVAKHRPLRPTVAARGILESQETIDLLLTDVVLPNSISGFDLAQEARRVRQDLKIVVISGYLREKAPGDLAGLTFLENPFRQRDLAETLAAAFR